MKTRHFLLAAGLLAPAPAFSQANPYRGLWVGEVKLDAVNEVSVPLDAQNIPRAPQPAVPTKTFDAANLRLILHVNGAGQVNLLKQVAILNRKAGAAQSENDIVLVTDERLYGSFPPQPAQRIASVVFDFGDAKATTALDEVVNRAAQTAATNVTVANVATQATNAAQAVINGADAAERFAGFLRDNMNSGAVTALSVSGQATATQDAVATALKGSFYGDTRGEDMIAALEAAVRTGTAAEKRQAAHNVAADFADVENKYQRFLSGELFGDMLLATADAAAAAAQAMPRKPVTALSGTPNTVPVTFTTAAHGLTNTDRIRLSGAPIAAWNGEHPVTAVDATQFSLPVAFVAGKTITGYAAAATAAPLTVEAPGHGLVSGARVSITGAGTTTYNGTFYITRLDDDSFSIPVNYVDDPSVKGKWAARAGVITGFETAAAAGSGVKITSPGHGLNNGEVITITGAGAAVYNGAFPVTRVDANAFTIAVAFGGNPAVKGAWAILNSVAGYGPPDEVQTMVTCVAHGLNTGDAITIAGSGKPAYNARHVVEKVDADSFLVPVLFDAADGIPAARGSWSVPAGGTWRLVAPVASAADGSAKVNDARAEALRIKMTAYDDTRGTDAIATVLAAIIAGATDADGSLSQIKLAAENAGRLALADMVTRSSLSRQIPSADYTAFIRANDPRLTDFREIASIAGAAAAAGAVAENANALHTAASLFNKAKERAVAALTAVYAAAARAQRQELPLTGGFGPGATSLTGTIFLPANHPTNPFRHRRHPDHSIGLDLTRVVTLNFDGAAGDSLAATGYGVDSISGTYGEEIHGLHKPLGPQKNIGLKVSGTFTLHRLSRIDALNSR